MRVCWLKPNWTNLQDGPAIEPEFLDLGGMHPCLFEHLIGILSEYCLVGRFDFFLLDSAATLQKGVALAYYCHKTHNSVY